MGSALPGLGLPSKADMYAAALEGLVSVDGLILDKHANVPPLYAAGIRFDKRPHDTWRRIDQIIPSGWSDCEGLAPWRAAELRRGRGVDGVVDGDARVGCYHTGPRSYHAIVIRGDDSIEDPSVICGMRARAGMPATREQMNAINGMWPRMRSRVDVVSGDDEWSAGVVQNFVENPDGSLSAEIKIPLKDGSSIVATTPPVNKDWYKGILSRPGDFLERPENTAQLEKLGPYGKVAAAVIRNPWAREARAVTHNLLRQIPGLGRLF